MSPLGQDRSPAGQNLSLVCQDVSPVGQVMSHLGRPRSQLGRMCSQQHRPSVPAPGWDQAMGPPGHGQSMERDLFLTIHGDGN